MDEFERKEYHKYMDFWRVYAKDTEEIRKHFFRIDGGWMDKGIYINLDTLIFREYEMNGEHCRVIFYGATDGYSLDIMESYAEKEPYTYMCLINNFMDEQENPEVFASIMKAKEDRVRSGIEFWSRI